MKRQLIQLTVAMITIGDGSTTTPLNQNPTLDKKFQFYSQRKLQQKQNIPHGTMTLTE